MRVELFGVPRIRAGRGEVWVEAASVGEALRGLEEACPGLAGGVVRDGRLGAAYRLCLNGDRFVSDPGTPLAGGDTLILLAADVGG